VIAYLSAIALASDICTAFGAYFSLSCAVGLIAGQCIAWGEA